MSYNIFATSFKREFVLNHIFFFFFNRLDLDIQMIMSPMHGLKMMKFPLVKIVTRWVIQYFAWMLCVFSYKFKIHNFLCNILVSVVTSVTVVSLFSWPSILKLRVLISSTISLSVRDLHRNTLCRQSCLEEEWKRMRMVCVIRTVGRMRA